MKKADRAVRLEASPLPVSGMFWFLLFFQIIIIVWPRDHLSGKKLVSDWDGTGAEETG